MKPTLASQNPSPSNLVFLKENISKDYKTNVLDGLRSKQKMLPAWYLYDDRGSDLFNSISKTTAYYPTRTEQEIYLRYAKDIAEVIGKNVSLIELGPGDMSKVRLLLDDIEPTNYIGIDVSEKELFNQGACLARENPWLNVIGLCGDFSTGLIKKMSKYIDNDSRRIIFYPGSTIGNIEPAEAVSFLRVLKNTLGLNGMLMVGVDYCKDRKLLEKAYNDPEGYTEGFNLNLLVRLNREYSANFNAKFFRHHAFFNEKQSRIEMHLVSKKEQNIIVGEDTIKFRPGETIHTESSYKYTNEAFISMAREGGFDCEKVFVDTNGWFGVYILQPY